jgi:peptidyl-prolyl cis-trans isomerase C
MRFIPLLLGASIAFGQQPSSPADPVVLTIGSETLTKSQFEDIISSLPEQQRAQAQTPAGRRKIAEQLSDLKTLAAEGRAQKLDQTPKAKIMIALQQDQVVANLTFGELGDQKPDDAALHAYYEAHKQEWEEVKARHILIRMQGSPVPLKPNQKDLTDAEALTKVKALRAKIVAGTDFASVAKTDSDDAGNAPQGGDLGTFTKGRMVPDFDKAAFSLETGKLSEPVKTQFGYHLIMVDGHSTKSFEEKRADMEKAMKPEMAQKGLEALKKKTPTVYDETYFGK